MFYKAYITLIDSKLMGERSNNNNNRCKVFHIKSFLSNFARF